MKIFQRSILVFAISLFFLTGCQQKNNVIFHSKDYTIFSDSVQQGNFTAKAISRQEVVSNYESPQTKLISSKIIFKFSINRKDNEMGFAINHTFVCKDSINETPLIKFGQPLKDSTSSENLYLKPNTVLKIRMDMRDVLKDFSTKGYFTTFKGDKIFKEDFKELYVAGETAPMNWDFDNLHQNSDLQMKDPDGDGIYETTLILNAKKDQKQISAHWKLNRDISAFPQYQSDYVLSDALYNMSLEEMENAVEKDSTLRTGKEWAGVWTRDISYSIILSMAYMQPKVARNSLMRKVNAQKRIIQDTGTGGAYPASTDRMIWAVAAYEIYKVSGDKNWLQTAYEIVRNSIEDDLLNAHDLETGMVRGESSFLDWREQTYPKWMQPADIFESENLGTNAVHFQANEVLSEMAHLLGKKNESEKYHLIAERIKNGINQILWRNEKGYYAQYLYGKNYKLTSPKSEALGEALSVYFGIADEQKSQSVIAKTPQTAFGISCIYPQITGITSYHNNAVWPFVQTYWALASAKVGNEKSVLESIAAIYRAQSLFATNKENFVADNGDFAGTVINSSNMLWSLSGSIALIHKILFGIEFKSDRLIFHPFVPKSLKGKRTLTNFKYRNSTLHISVEGFGNQIKSFSIDGRETEPFEISENLTGTHSIQIILADNDLSSSVINKVENEFAPTTPEVKLMVEKLTWLPVENAIEYKIFRNGKEAFNTKELSFDVKDSTYCEYQVIAVNQKGLESFASEPVIVNSVEIQLEKDQTKIFPGFKINGFIGPGFIEISKTKNRTITFESTISSDGNYAIDFRYANGNGPTNTENKCAIRTLSVDQKFSGAIIFPQRGIGEWSNWGYSNSIKTHLTKGKHFFTLSFEPNNENMNGDINQALLDLLRIRKME